MILCATAVTLGFLHTLLGPDHYLPFIMMGRARRWSLAKTAWITFFCGLGHVGSSIIVGIIGVALGLSVARLESLESVRGNLAAWFFIAFGLVYFLWGVRKAILNKPHTHWHLHTDGEKHTHIHTHMEEHAHAHDEQGSPNITPWVLFTIFVFGPCEPLIPVLMYPAARNSTIGLILVTALFSIVTILTMIGVVLITSLGINILPIGRLERYMHAAAGAMICLSGLGIVFLGL